jgi:hypothetical protein
MAAAAAAEEMAGKILDADDETAELEAGFDADAKSPFFKAGG